MNSRGVILTAVAVVLVTACRVPQRDAAPEPKPAARAAGPTAVEASFTPPRRQVTRDLYPDTLRETGSHQLTVARLRRTLRDTPWSAATWRALAQCHLDPDAPPGVRDSEAAINAARAAVSYLDEPDAAYFVTLGTACYVHGNLAEAIDAYSKALDSAARGHGSLEHPEELRDLLRELRRGGA